MLGWMNDMHGIDMELLIGFTPYPVIFPPFRGGYIECISLIGFTPYPAIFSPFRGG